MKTQRDIVTEVIAAKVAAGIEKDMVKKSGFGDRIKKAGEIVLADGVKAVSYNDFNVVSGTDSAKSYHVNGDCDCQDAKNYLLMKEGKNPKTYAPSGYCKHKLAVELWKHARAALKELSDLGGIPHTFHRWTCTAHRELPIICWHHPCPDPVDVVCPTCTAENPNVPSPVEATIKEEGAPTQDDTVDPDTGECTETPLPEEEPTMITTIGETVKQVVASLSNHANGQTPEPPAPVLVTEQYEPAPALTPKVPALPEAGASLNIKVRVDNFELMYTMRGHQDSEVLERLPNVLATLERLMKTEVDHDESFLKRLMHAFFPRPSKYTGK